MRRVGASRKSEVGSRISLPLVKFGAVNQSIYELQRQMVVAVAGL